MILLHLLAGLILGIMVRDLYARVYLGIRHWRQNRRWALKLAEGVPLWEIFHDK